MSKYSGLYNYRNIAILVKIALPIAAMFQILSFGSVIKKTKQIEYRYDSILSNINQLRSANRSIYNTEYPNIKGLNPGSSLVLTQPANLFRINPAAIPSVLSKSFRDSFSTVISQPIESRIDEIRFGWYMKRDNFHGIKIVLGNKPIFPFESMNGARFSDMDILRVGALAFVPIKDGLSINIHAVDARGNILVNVIAGRVSNFGNVQIWLSSSFIEIFDKNSDLVFGFYQTGVNEFLYQGYNRGFRNIVVYGLKKVILLPISASDAELKAAITEAGVYAIAPTAKAI